MRVLYNEWDEPTAAWLRQLIDGCHLPSGSVDTRSIGDVRAYDLRDFDQCHFFAGIGGWPLALRWAGLEGTPGIWTGSPPCQPFSVAGKGLGQADERHLAPVWIDLIRECRPRLIFGEQVAAAICSGSDLRLLGLSPATVVAACIYAAHAGGIEPPAFLRRFAIMGHDGATACREAWREFATAAAIYTPEYSITDAAFRAIEGVRQTGWLDDLFDALEECGYACGAAVLPACSVGAPHIRKRLFFGAVRLADAYGWSSSNGDVQSGREHGLFPQGRSPVRKGCEGPRAQSDRLADAHEDRLRARREIRSVRSEHDTEHGGATCWLADTYSIGSNRSGPFRASRWAEYPECGDAGGLAHSDDTRPQGRAGMPERADEQPARSGSVESGPADPHHGFWSGADWLGCRDGKFRPVEPGTQPLATGISARVVRLRGYGNAIVPQVAAQFITEFLGAIADMQDEGLTP